MDVSSNSHMNLHGIIGQTVLDDEYDYKALRTSRYQDWMDDVDMSIISANLDKLFPKSSNRKTDVTDV